MMTKKQKKSLITVAVSGGFDPIHIGHIRMFREAKKLGDRLLVILNNDHWLMKKKGYIFMPEKERMEVIESICYVDEVVLTEHGPNPTDMSVCKSLEKIKPNIFANGGDRGAHNTPEQAVCMSLDCETVFAVGAGGKVQSSSWLLEKFSAYIADHQAEQPQVMRPWGGYTILKKSKTFWMKKLFLHDGMRCSLQKHERRDEFWYVLHGQMKVQIANQEFLANPGDFFFVPKMTKHRITGIKQGCILEAAFGQPLEKDIIRYSDDFGRA